MNEASFRREGRYVLCWLQQALRARDNPVIDAAVLLGNELGQLGISHDRLLDYALMIERHPDNVTAALIGGFVGSYLLELEGEAAQRAKVPLSEVLPEYPPDAGEMWGRDPPTPPTGARTRPSSARSPTSPRRRRPWAS